MTLSPNVSSDSLSDWKWNQNALLECLCSSFLPVPNQPHVGTFSLHTVNMQPPCLLTVDSVHSAEGIWEGISRQPPHGYFLFVICSLYLWKEFLDLPEEDSLCSMHASSYWISYSTTLLCDSLIHFQHPCVPAPELSSRKFGDWEPCLCPSVEGSNIQ